LILNYNFKIKQAETLHNREWFIPVKFPEQVSPDTYPDLKIAGHDLFSLTL